MKMEEIRAIMEDTSLTMNQRCANIEAMFLKATTPSALNIKPMKERAKRGASKAKGGLVQTETGLVQNGADHAEH